MSRSEYDFLSFLYSFSIFVYFLNFAFIISFTSVRKMTNENDTPTPMDTSDVIQTPLNAAATGVTTAGNITASTTAATTSTFLPAGNAADETTRRTLFGAGLYQTEEERASHARAAAAVRPARLGVGVGLVLGWRAFGPIKIILFGPS
ncbi:hypothetical protein IGI04_035916 [Brassica rapa subsp. trilocularis]|uniref:Uncharacterized protein n=1 Tax=Brassica rapa subsp. trilocularis TaxID=1813537 RepID=A0ABQ7LFB4_BRACM|nr:hypothetical protein IGI04_035916 [Brassica rapa subsp. trilocularis]